MTDNTTYCGYWIQVHIQSPQDAATLLSHLVVEPHENVYFLSLDKDWKVLDHNSQI